MLGAEPRENRIIKIETADKVLIIVKVCLKQLQLIVTMAINYPSFEIFKNIQNEFTR